MHASHTVAPNLPGPQGLLRVSFIIATAQDVSTERSSCNLTT